MIPGAVEILLVEDNPQDVELTLRSLRKLNLANYLVVARDGVEALDFVFAEGKFKDRNILQLPKLILLDLKLPKIDGIEVLRRIKANETTRVIPVVVLTSSNEERDILESYRIGANSYVVKPFEFDKFVESVAELGLYWLLLNEAPSK